MGNCCRKCPSCPIMQYDCCIDRRQSLNSDFRLPAPKKNASNGGFNARGNVFAVADDSAGLVDINTATEEMLMTLPHISRPIAHSIVEHRRAICGFRKVEDLALVSGMGANRLARIRSEIYASPVSDFEASGVNGSVDSVAWHHDSVYSSRSDLDGTSELSTQDPSSDSGVRNWYHDVRINVNTANIKQLLRLKGLQPNVAEKIVEYRNRHGIFTSIDDLRKVKGINKQLLEGIRAKLSLTEVESTPRKSSSRSPSKKRNKTVANNSSISTDLMRSNFLDDDQKELISLYGPLLEKSMRRSKPEASPRECDVIRIASWNLDRLDSDKVENPGVQEVIAMTLLENRFSIIAIQDIYSEEVLKKICDSINEASIPTVQRWKESRGRWKYYTLPSPADDSQLWPAIGYMYNSRDGIELVSATDLDLSSPFIRCQAALYQLEGGQDLTVVNVQQVHQKGEPVVNKLDITSLVATLKSSRNGMSQCVVLGYFGAPCTADVLSPLLDDGYQPLIDCTMLTDISTTHPHGLNSTQNIYLSPSLSALSVTGQSGVIRNGLTSPWIPAGWQWGGYVSSHCPVWADFARANISEVTSGERNIINSSSLEPLLDNTV